MKALNKTDIAALLIIAGYSSLSMADNEKDFLDMSLTQLMDMELTTASKFPQKKMDAPSAVTVITARDIKDFGYRTLADVMRSIRGLYTTYDRAYEYFGNYGFGRSGDYNSRLLLMIDGRRINDSIYDQAFIGTDGLIDLEDVERIEFVPGSGSSIYGSNALLGVMNVITKQGKDIQGVKLAGGFGSYGMDREKLSAGYHFDNGFDGIFSVSRYHSDGHKKLYFSEFDTPDQNNGIAESKDLDKNERYFAKLSYQDFTLEAAFSDRSKILPIANYETDFNSKEIYRDRNGFIEARYDGDIAKDINLLGRIYYGYYDFDAFYSYPETVNLDKERSQWWGTELKSVINLGDHKLVVGGEYQQNFSVSFKNFDVTPYYSYLDDSFSSYRYGIYIQDNVTFLDDFTLNAGVRYDYYSVSGNTINPRVALIYKPIDSLAVKLLYGTAFRAPNLFEKYYVLADYQKTSQYLMPERTRSFEAVVEYQPAHNMRWVANFFHNNISNLINLAEDPSDGLLVYGNSGKVQMQGLGLEGDYFWDNGIRLRGSYSYTYAKDSLTQSWLANSPKHLAKLNLSAPLYEDKVRLGAEWQYTSARKTKNDMRTDSYNMANLTLTVEKFVPGFEVNASVYNLLGQRYTLPAGDETMIDKIPQDGRNFRLWFTYHFQ